MVALMAAQALATAGLCVWLAFGRPLGIPGQWTWEVHGREIPLVAAVRAVMVALAVLAMVAWALCRRRRGERRDIVVLCGLVVLVVALQWSVAALGGQATFTTIAGTASPVSTEYFGAAWSLDDPVGFCRDYAAALRGGGYHHVATHPPGAVLTYWLIIHFAPAQVFEDIATVAVGVHPKYIAETANQYPGISMTVDQVGPALACVFVMGLCAALTVVPLYALTRGVATRRAALIAAALFALAPAPVLFFQGLDAPVVLLTVTGLWLTHLGLARRSWLIGAAAGVVYGLACFISFGAAAGVVVAGLYALVRLWRSHERRGTVAACLGMIGGLGLALVAEHLVCGGQLPEVFRLAMAAHRRLTWVEHGRTYGVWLGMNPIEFACFLGLPVVVIVGWAAAGTARSWPRNATSGGVAGLVTLVLLIVSGSVRGEVGRVWLLLMPPLMVWAADRLVSAPSSRATLWIVTGVLLVTQLVGMGLALTPAVLPY